MPRGETTTDETRAEVQRRVAAGESMAQVARDLGISKTTVSRYAAKESTDARRSLAKANEAKKIDLEAMHLRILGKLAVGAERAAERMTEPYTVHGFGETGVMLHELTEPPADAVRNFSTSAAIGVDKIGAFLARQSDPSLDAAKSLAASLAEGFARFADSNIVDSDAGSNSSSELRAITVIE